MSMRVINAIADARDVDPLDLEVPLFDAINPEALDNLFQPETTCAVTFEYDGQSVTVESDGTVVVEDLQPRV